MVPFANGHWDRALSRFWLLTPLRSISIYTLEAESVPVLDGMNLLENHDISFRRNELQCSIETLSVRASDSEFTVIGTSPRRVCLTRQQVTSLRIRENKIKTFLQFFLLGCLSIFFLAFVITQIRHLSLRTDHGPFPSRHSQILLFFLVKICASHLHFSPSCVPLQRLNCLQTVIDGQQSRRTLDEMSKSHRSRLDTCFGTRCSGSSQVASSSVEESMYLQTNTERGLVVRDVPFVCITFSVTLLE